MKIHLVDLVGVKQNNCVLTLNFRYYLNKIHITFTIIIDVTLDMASSYKVYQYGAKFQSVIVGN